MKHHNLYRLALIGYIGGGFFVILGFLLAVLAILTGWGAPEGLAWLFIPTGLVGLVGGGISHVYAIEGHKELKPLPKQTRERIEREARERRADLLLAKALQQEEEQHKAIEGRTVEDDLHEEMQRRLRPKDPWQ